jgi:hypothetical protein
MRRSVAPPGTTDGAIEKPGVLPISTANAVDEGGSRGEDGAPGTPPWRGACGRCRRTLSGPQVASICGLRASCSTGGGNHPTMRVILRPVSCIDGAATPMAPVFRSLSGHLMVSLRIFSLFRRRGRFWLTSASNSARTSSGGWPRSCRARRRARRGFDTSAPAPTQRRHDGLRAVRSWPTATRAASTGALPAKAQRRRSCTLRPAATPPAWPTGQGKRGQASSPTGRRRRGGAAWLGSCPDRAAPLQRQARSKRSRFITLAQAATKSRTSFSRLSAQA